ncbi:MAG TPA: hypothetical protein VFD58_08325 [Blastocatellia bacterium]|nr:hypothetical protein [Blastocatellia bacterium]
MSVTSMPEISRAGKTADFTGVREWLREHRHEFTGQWGVLDGNRRIGPGPDPRPLVAQARAAGVEIPFVKFTHADARPEMGGWL